MLESENVHPDDREIAGLKPGDPGYAALKAALTGKIIIDSDLRATRRARKRIEIWRRVKQIFTGNLQ